MRIWLVIVVVWMLVSASDARAQYREDVVGISAPNSIRPATVSNMPAVVGKQAAAVEWDSTIANVHSDEERLLYLGGAAMGLALFDYVGYNLARDRGDHGSLVVYRVLQGLVQLAVSWMLYEKLGLPSAIGFNVLWWTWGLDAMFYGYTELFNVGGSWSGRGAFKKDIMGNNCYWASWTPVGLAQGADPTKKIAGDTIIAQSIIGAILAVTLTVHF